MLHRTQEHWAWSQHDILGVACGLLSLFVLASSLLALFEGELASSLPALLCKVRISEPLLWCLMLSSALFIMSLYPHVLDTAAADGHSWSHRCRCARLFGVHGLLFLAGFVPSSHDAVAAVFGTEARVTACAPYLSEACWQLCFLTAAACELFVVSTQKYLGRAERRWRTAALSALLAPLLLLLLEGSGGVSRGPPGWMLRVDELEAAALVWQCQLIWHFGIAKRHDPSLWSTAVPWTHLGLLFFLLGQSVVLGQDGFLGICGEGLSLCVLGTLAFLGVALCWPPGERDTWLPYDDIERPCEAKLHCQRMYGATDLLPTMTGS